MLLHIRPYLPAVFRHFFETSVQHTEGAHDVFLGDEAGNSGDSCLPVTPSEGDVYKRQVQSSTGKKGGRAAGILKSILPFGSLWSGWMN